MFTEEFNDLSPETRAKVVKKIEKIYRWIDHSGGWNEVSVMALGYVVFKAFEDMGFDVVLKPTTAEAAERLSDEGIIITD